MTTTPAIAASSAADQLRRAPLPGQAMLQRQQDFASVIGRAQQNASAPSAARRLTPERAARQAAEDFVSIALIQPILKEFRANSNAAPPFAPGPAEKQFRGFMDAATSRQIVRAQGFPLVDRLANLLLKRGTSAPTASKLRAGQPEGEPLTGVAPAADLNALSPLNTLNATNPVSPTARPR